ncbi:MAG: polyprenyl synthetase family protein [Spirochaetales bacterium]|uniref:Polyprenyl synthetase family protein n=1 Tax=Candidatus Thalassospirochaeta sargassi TaxID=3119039 RepID=A0AAJ1MIU6_9SPIO|nr:polyprenyl synthetase family protein [Spirochaetales bacterium]
MKEIVTSTHDKQLKEDLAEVKDILGEIADTAPGIVREDIRKLVSGNGKMLRPSFTTIAGRYGNFEGERIYNMAAAVELLHNATLIHDDIIDDASIRRGKPAIHMLHGNKLAILAGDYLFSRSIVVASEKSRTAQYGRLAGAVAKICEGEIIQDSEKYVLNPSIRSYKRRIAGKTAVLFAISLYIGANEAGCSSDDCSTFSRIGYNVGMAFQIIDDLLDITGTPAVTGKPTGRDITEGIYTLPVLYALENDDGRLGRLLSKYPYRRHTVKKITKLVCESSGPEKAAAQAELYSDRAMREISKLDEGYTKYQLSVLVKNLLKRNY